MVKSNKNNNNHDGGGEIQISKSPAEFFAENQSIAGFDNMGKSLYTSIRELVENSLDACESIGQLPDISVTIEELTQNQFNVLRGLSTGDSPVKTKTNKNNNASSNSMDDDEQKQQGKNGKTTKKSTTTKGGNKKDDNKNNNSNSKKRKSTGSSSSSSQESYFKIIVKDNGCGMSHDAIPNLLGRVLSGSKYGVRQTRGKFGLGAKMALIWSKKSTGVPIKVRTTHNPPMAASTIKKGKSSPTAGGGSGGKYISTCILDIDIYKNCPRIIRHDKVLNKVGFVGTEFEIIIAGNWTTYKSRIVQYIQQLAIITPYAKLTLNYSNKSDTKKKLHLAYDRRSEQMPKLAKEVKYHPSSINNLLIQQLLIRSKCKTLLKFLCTDLSGISPALSKKLIQMLVDKHNGKKRKRSHYDEDGSDEENNNDEFSEDMIPSNLSDKQITLLTQLLKSSEAKSLYRSPDGSCLSPLGEYNLNLGISKVLNPQVIATARDKPSSYDGHPFIVEAAVALGGGGNSKDQSSSSSIMKEGLNVIRFANRIPLLFEGGADVATRVAQTKIRWSNYKIDYKKDKIGVFVSIVSTKIPFKGTGKEYIGDDITEISNSVKKVLQRCCNELRTHLTKKNALKDIKERKSRLIKYIPDIGRSLFGILDTMRKRKRDEDNDDGGDDDDDEGSSKTIKNKKKQRVSNKKEQHEAAIRDTDDAYSKEIIEKISGGVGKAATGNGDNLLKEITEESIKDCLLDAVEKHQGDDFATLTNALNSTSGVLGASANNQKRKMNASDRAKELIQKPSYPLYLVPLYNFQAKSNNDIQHPLFTFRPMNKTY